MLEQKAKATQTQHQHKHTLLKTGKGISRQTFPRKPPNRVYDNKIKHIIDDDYE